MTDFLFKMYYSFFKDRGEAGALAGIILLSFPLTFVSYGALLFGMSYFIRISQISVFVLMLGIIVAGLAMQHLLKRKYIDGNRYKAIKIENPAVYGLIGVLVYLISIPFFAIVFVSLLSE